MRQHTTGDDDVRNIDLRLPLLSVLTASLALIICTLILAGSVVRIKGHQGTLKVTGSAREQVRSDYILWHGEITQQAPTLPQAYHDLRESERKATAYFLAQGLTPQEISPAKITSTEIDRKPNMVMVKDNEGLPTSVPSEPVDKDGSPMTHKIAAYQLTEGMDIQSAKVDIVERISRSATELIASGVTLTSSQPQYIFRNMAELKLKILAEAGKNARARAEQIATSGGGRVGDLLYAHMGVMQVTPAYEDTEVSSAGTEDTTSLDKKVTAVVSVGYTIR